APCPPGCATSGSSRVAACPETVRPAAEGLAAPCPPAVRLAAEAVWPRAPGSLAHPPLRDRLPALWPVVAVRPAPCIDNCTGATVGNASVHFTLAEHG